MMENPKNRKWKVLTSEYLARKPWFTVRHESLELPDGRRIPDYYVFEYPDWINVTAVTRDGRFVLIDQYRHGLGETSYEIPAGVTEPSDASPLDAAQRELMEETGYGGGQWRLLTTLSANPDTEQPHLLLPRHGRRTARRTASRPDGGPARAPLDARRGAGAAPHRPYPAGPDGRAAVALFRRRQRVAASPGFGRRAAPDASDSRPSGGRRPKRGDKSRPVHRRHEKGRPFRRVALPAGRKAYLPTVCANATNQRAGSSPRAASSSASGTLPRVIERRPCPAV